MDRAETKVILFAEQPVLNFLAGGLADDDKIAVTGKTFYMDDFKRIIKDNKYSVAVFYMGSQDIYTNELCNLLNEHKILYVAICHNAQDGFEMLKHGASEMLILHDADIRHKNKSFFHTLKNKIHTVDKLYVEDSARMLKHPQLTAFNKIIAIGSSTGGTEAVHSIINRMPADIPPILIVQHMPPVFTKLYAQRLDMNSKISVWEARDGDILRPGLALLAPGDFHMTLACRNGVYYVECKHGIKVHGQCPSVDILFESIARFAPRISLGVILTGMGSDGATGLLKMRNSGSRTLGQDKESSIVYGMPKVAFDIGAVERQVHLDVMAEAIIDMVRNM